MSPSGDINNICCLNSKIVDRGVFRGPRMPASPFGSEKNMLILNVNNFYAYSLYLNTVENVGLPPTSEMYRMYAPLSQSHFYLYAPGCNALFIEGIVFLKV